jgi:hypothetical protein
MSIEWIAKDLRPPWFFLFRTSKACCWLSTLHSADSSTSSGYSPTQLITLEGVCADFVGPRRAFSRCIWHQSRWKLAIWDQQWLRGWPHSCSSSKSSRLCRWMSCLSPGEIVYCHLPVCLASRSQKMRSTTREETIRQPLRSNLGRGKKEQGDLERNLISNI